MYKVIDSEIVLKSYFTKYPNRKKITYQQLKEIRFKAEPAIPNVYIDISYSSIRAVKYTYPNSIRVESQGVRVIGSGFKQSKMADMATFHELEVYL